MISPGHDDTLHFMRQLASNLHQILDGLVHLDLEAGREADEDRVHRPEVMDNPFLTKRHFLCIYNCIVNTLEKDERSLVTGVLC